MHNSDIVAGAPAPMSVRRRQPAKRAAPPRSANGAAPPLHLGINATPCRQQHPGNADKDTRGPPGKQQRVDKLAENGNEADTARSHHDYFNLLALPLVIISAFMNYDYSPLTGMSSFQLLWTGNFFWLNWALTLFYFVVDLAWVVMVPICVKSPGVIVKHHIAAMAYLAAPIYYPEFRWFAGAVLSVEINTWFLILRRVVYKLNGGHGDTGDGQVSPIIVETVSILFYTTWVLIRCIVYPAVLVTFLKMAVIRKEQYGTWLQPVFLFIPVHFSLCCLNIKWTYDLFKPIVGRWFGVGPKTPTIQNGL